MFSTSRSRKSAARVSRLLVQRSSAPTNSPPVRFYFQAEDRIRATSVTGVQTCALPIFPAEHADWVRADPILNYVRVLTGRNDLTRDQALALDRKANEAMAAARKYAEASPFPAPEKIGRASCRERGDKTVVDGAGRKAET